MRVSTSDDACTGRLANWALAPGFGEANAFIGYCVEVRCLDDRMSGTTHNVVSVLVRKDKKDIRLHFVIPILDASCTRAHISGRVQSLRYLTGAVLFTLGVNKFSGPPDKWKIYRKPVTLRD